MDFAAFIPAFPRPADEEPVTFDEQDFATSTENHFTLSQGKTVLFSEDGGYPPLCPTCFRRWHGYAGAAID